MSTLLTSAGTLLGAAGSRQSRNSYRRGAMNGQKQRNIRGVGLLVIVLAVGLAVLAGIALLQVLDAGKSPVQPAGTASESAAVPPQAAPEDAVTVRDLQTMVSGTDALTISVLGDSTGDEPGEWVDLWARHLSKRGTVTLHFWDAATNDWKAHPIVYPGPDRAITVWNGSRSGASHAYPLEHLDRIQPSRPSFTVLSFGHNPAPERADRGAAELLAAADAKWAARVPAAIVLQNPSEGLWEKQTADSVAALRSWAPGAGYPTIDVNEAFRVHRGLPDLLTDDVHPNSAGQRLWADTVAAALG
ncbi:SGNH/GDSL hydrolase family protein [Arthrobacter oryzae]|uniref:SGNH/GDSL hydrolase family protein n=1 Tax=Arthrobacter oryzae TaxID=409290 RepID=UPI00285E9B31|nr:GDSL-type esterase/lipase family protein [Arthrobacter oryzae]MDR6505636.1 hypothetical protein [Arthrobacter oryzae]